MQRVPCGPQRVPCGPQQVRLAQKKLFWFRVDFGTAIKLIRLHALAPPRALTPRPFTLVAELGIRYMCPRNSDTTAICMDWAGFRVCLRRPTTVPNWLEMALVNEDSQRALALVQMV